MAATAVHKEERLAHQRLRAAEKGRKARAAKAATRQRKANLAHARYARWQDQERTLHAKTHQEGAPASARNAWLTCWANRPPHPEEIR